MSEESTQDKYSEWELDSYLYEATLLAGDLYWLRSGDKKTLLCRAGDPINLKLIDKMKKNKARLRIEEVIPSVQIEEGVALFQNFKHASLESIRSKEKLASSREELLKWIKASFWDSEESASLLLLVFCCHNSFSSFNRNCSKELIEYSSSIYKRSSILGALLVAYSVLCGYMDFFYLQDLYNVAFLLDYGLLDKLDYRSIKALKMEIKDPQSGLSYLKKHSEEEATRFSGHTFSNGEEIKEKYGKFFNNSSVLYLIEWHHERSNGKGFPRGLNSDEASDVEMLLIFVSSLVDYDNYSYSNNDGTGILQNFINKENGKTSSIISFRLHKMIIKMFNLLREEEEVKHENEDESKEEKEFLEIAGL